MISNVQDEYTFLYISNNPLGELQNNVLAPLKRLSSLTIISSRHKLKHIQSYAFNASNLKSLTLVDANFTFRHQTFILTKHFVSVLGFIHLSYILYNSLTSDSNTATRMLGTLRQLRELELFDVGWKMLPEELLHCFVSLRSLDLGNNNTFSLSLNNPQKAWNVLISVDIN